MRQVHQEQPVMDENSIGHYLASILLVLPAGVDHRRMSSPSQAVGLMEMACGYEQVSDCLATDCGFQSTKSWPELVVVGSMGYEAH